MLDAVAQRAQAAGMETLLGYYLPTKKNGMVADHYEKLGFRKIEASSNGASEFALSLTEYSPNNRHIKVMELIHG
jgi:predicted enzyme involved in methoxymalonyl-ACP biosynthesis